MENFMDVPILVWSFDYGADSEPADWEHLLHDPIVPIIFDDMAAAKAFCVAEVREALGMEPLKPNEIQDGLYPPTPVVITPLERRNFLRKAMVRTGKGHPTRHLEPSWLPWEGGFTWDCPEFRVRFFATRGRAPV
jgi:hypothetical protein